MNADTATFSPQNFLILSSKNTATAVSSSLVRAVKRQRYQSPNTPWHVVLVLPSLLSYAYTTDIEHYHADWHKAMTHYNTISRLLNLSSEHIHFIHGSHNKLIRQYKRKYPDMVFPVNRTVLEKNLLIGRWFLRKVKRKIQSAYLSLKGGRGLQNNLEEYRGFLSSSFFL